MQLFAGMPRPLRAIDDGLIHHVVKRGKNRQDVFHKEADFEAFAEGAWRAETALDALSVYEQ